MYTAAALAGLSLLAGASAQGVGTNTAEVHPSLTISNCVAGGACTTETDQVVLDANWRWTHSTTSLTNCYTGNKWDPTLCPDTATCSKNCVLEGADYSGTYGISASGNALKLGFVTTNSNGVNVGSRTYLMDTTTTYKEFKLLNQEFTFDVDVSNLPCGLNGALYFVAMDADGGTSKYPTNTAGAKYGTGYGDSQCPRDLKFINGQANSVGWNGTNANSGTGNFGSCSPEMDIWEANSISAAYTPHPCSVTVQTECTGATCVRNTGLCDGDGCDFNSYRMGNLGFYGPGKTVDTTKPITVVTQFVTADGTATGTLSAINRFYVQNGVVIPNSNSTISGVTGNSITPAFCDAQKTAFGDTNVFDQKGGLAQMGKAMLNGMVLVMSIWDDTSVAMNWLDSTYPPTASTSAPGVARGTCDTASGVAATVEAAHPGASVTYSNIKVGPIGSTFASGSGSGTGSGTTTKATTTSTAKSTSTSSGAGTTGCAAAKYGQCGGIGWSGCTACASGSTCKVGNAYYSQCL